MRKINKIVLHCSATPEGKHFTAKDIDRWHRQQGWAKIGYHYVILLDGTIEKGRDESEVGAHVANHNSDSIGICYIGGVDANDVNKAKDTRTPAQKEAMKRLVADLLKRYPGAEVLGHRDFPGVKKACPSFDARAWWSEASKSLVTTPSTPSASQPPAQAVRPVYVQAVKGDTIYGIARELGLDPKEVVALNPNANNLKVGQYVRIK